MSPQEKSITNSVCLNHPDQPAVTRCITCFKPICSQCVIDADGREFCSRQCVESYFSTRNMVDNYNAAAQQRKKRARIMLLIKLIILGGLAYGAYVYFRKEPDKLRELQEKAGQITEKAKETIR